MNKLDDELHSSIAFGVGVASGILLIVIICYYMCKHCPTGDLYDRNIVSPEVTESVPPIEMQPPSYEEAIRLADALATRRRRNDNETSDNVHETDTQVDEATRDSNTGDSSNDNKNSGTSNIQDDSGDSFDLGEHSVVNPSSRYKKVSKSSAADDSGVKSGSGDDTVDNFDDVSVGSAYDTASGGSEGGGGSRAPSPWLDF